MPKEHLKNRIDSEVLRMADAIAAKLSEDTGLDITSGQAVEKAIKELHAKLFPKKRQSV